MVVDLIVGRLFDRVGKVHNMFGMFEPEIREVN